MSIKIGTTEIENVKVGDTDIDWVTVNNKVVLLSKTNIKSGWVDSYFDGFPNTVTDQMDYTTGLPMCFEWGTKETKKCIEFSIDITQIANFGFQYFDQSSSIQPYGAWNCSFNLAVTLNNSSSPINIPIVITGQTYTDRAGYNFTHGWDGKYTVAVGDGNGNTLFSYDTINCIPISKNPFISLSFRIDLDDTNHPFKIYDKLADTTYPLELNLSYNQAVVSPATWSSDDYPKVSLASTNKGYAFTINDQEQVFRIDITRKYFQTKLAKSIAVRGETISFTIGNKTYYAEQGMTWGEWVDSEYNTTGYFIDNGGGVAVGAGPSWVHYYDKETTYDYDQDSASIIVAGRAYSLTHSGGCN
jgi:hypothetical protein